MAGRLYAELARVSAEVRADPEHPVRHTLDRLLARFADDLWHDPETIERASGVLQSLLEQTEVRRAFGDVISAGRRLLLEMVDDPGRRAAHPAGRRAGRSGPPAGPGTTRCGPGWTPGSRTRPAMWSPTTRTS